MGKNRKEMRKEDHGTGCGQEGCFWRRLRRLTLCLGLGILLAAGRVTAQDLPETEDSVPAMAPEFWQLYQENPELVGWLQVNERIDAPVVQRRGDNEYYLHHDFYGEDSAVGTLFADGYNQLWPRDRALYLFGHNMLSGAAFGTLPSYEREEYLRAHPLIRFRTIYETEEEHSWYAVAAGFHASMKESDPQYFFVLEPFVFAEEEAQRMQEEAARRERQSEEPEEDTDSDTEAWNQMLTERIWERYAAYLAQLEARSWWRAPVDLTIEDDLLILVTCSYYQEDGRFLLVCRRLREDETPEQIRQLYVETADAEEE